MAADRFRLTVADLQDRIARLRADFAALAADFAALVAPLPSVPPGEDRPDIDVLDLADALMLSDPSMTPADAMLTAWWESTR